jgi:hydrogenase nickel incorporation protein HypB
MCTTCGCGTSEIHIEGEGGKLHEHEHIGSDGKIYQHVHDHSHGHGHDGHTHDHPHDHDHAHGLLNFGSGAARSHSPGMTQSRMVRIERDILAKNDDFATANRQRIQAQGILALNLVSSPGSGKTSLLVRTIDALQGKTPLAVIEGDQQTSVDADRIRATGTAAVQINTGKGCHLDAAMVGRALEQLACEEASLLFIENVGNLVCPAAFDLGEAAKVAILSVTEGEDKPLKYPDMFQAARLMLLNKCDLLPYVDFDVEHAIANARRVNPAIEIISLSARTGEGFDAWLAWIAREHGAIQTERCETIASIKHLVPELEAQLAAKA